MVAGLHRVTDGRSIVFHSEAKRSTGRGYHFHKRVQKTNRKELDLLGCGSIFRRSTSVYIILYLFLVISHAVNDASINI